MATNEIARAYIRCIPKIDEGAKGSARRAIEGALDGLGGAGSKHGISLGAGLLGGLAQSGVMAVGQLIADGIEAATSGVINLVQSAVGAYGEYEQLVGGVETLFGGSADRVMEYADRAYVTAGLSANQYMETVTSFSASLLQGLGGDTEAAAEIADIAITDMADNANKMGTSIDMIQNAYQGLKFSPAA